MDLDVDHVTVAGGSLDALDAAFEGVGLTPSYGGTHSNGVTHMSTVTLPDGRYVELISTRESGADSPWWDAHIRADAGPCAWAVQVDDAAATAERLRERGVAVDGPFEFARERPDGVRLEWELVYLSEGAEGGDPGQLLPFCIADTTPREQRVGEPLEGSGVDGIETVVIGVPALDTATERIRAAFDLARPVQETSDHLGARIARFEDAPVALATPDGGGWLADRLEEVGTSPCAYLFGADDRAADGFPVAEREPWGEGEAAWLDSDAVGGIRGLGLST